MEEICQRACGFANMLEAWLRDPMTAQKPKNLA